uniref:Synaptotagmin-17 n=1 Tax=Amazona collaria TaxID=241587 RepID=A0A8B9IU14_9PSIT
MSPLNCLPVTQGCINCLTPGLPKWLVWSLGADKEKGCLLQEDKQLTLYSFLLIGPNEVELGELLLSLNYLPSAGRLNVDIIRAKQLLQTDMSQGSDPFVKIQLVHGLKLTKTKKTSCMRGTIDPFYNESFSFKVPQEELENASLVFTVYGHNVKSSNDFIGRIVIGQYSTGAPESNHWRRMLNAHRTAVEQWHSLRSREECDRVSPASLEVT